MIKYVVQGSINNKWRDIDQDSCAAIAKKIYDRHLGKPIISGYQKYRIIKRSCVEEIVEKERTRDE